MVTSADETSGTAPADAGGTRTARPALPAAVAREPLGRRLSHAPAVRQPLLLLRAAHPVQAVLTALGVAVAAAVSGRAPREVAVVFATVVVGQGVLGWHNDVVDRERDAVHGRTGKPVAEGLLDPGTVWFAVVVALLLELPLALSTGVTAGVYYVLALVVGLVGNVAMRTGRFSWVTWAVSFGLLPFYLSWGGWGGAAHDAAPQVAVVVVAALLGVGVHLLRSSWGLADDDADGWSHYPLRLARRVGADGLLRVAVAWCAITLVALVVLGLTVGLHR